MLVDATVASRSGANLAVVGYIVGGASGRLLLPAPTLVGYGAMGTRESDRDSFLMTNSFPNSFQFAIGSLRRQC